MATLKEHFLAFFDRLAGWDHQFGETKSEHTRDFYTTRGVKMAIISKDGHIRCLGGSRWITHQYDAKGNLLSRTLKRKILKKDELIVYGEDNVYEAYINQPTKEWEPDPLMQ